MRQGLLAIAVTAALTGCVNLGPDYERPALEMPDAYLSATVEAETLAELRW